MFEKLNVAKETFNLQFETVVSTFSASSPDTELLTCSLLSIFLDCSTTIVLSKMITDLNLSNIHKCVPFSRMWPIEAQLLTTLFTLMTLPGLIETKVSLTLRPVTSF